MSYRKWLSIITLCLMSTQSQAGIVFDSQNFAVNLQTAISTAKMLQNMGRSYQKLTSQLSELKQLRDLDAKNLSQYVHLSKRLLKTSDVLTHYSGDSDFSRMDNTMTANDRDAVIGDYYPRPSTSRSVSQQLNHVLSNQALKSITRNASRNVSNRQRVDDLLDTLAHQHVTQQRRVQLIQSYGDDLSTLGPHSELKTQQLNAAQTNLLLAQQEESLTSLRQMQKLQVIARAEKEGAYVDDFERELKRLRFAAHNVPTPIRRKRWGTL